MYFKEFSTFSYATQLLEFTKQDIYSFFGGNFLFHKLYFFPLTYPPSNIDENSNLFKNNLEHPALESGSPIFCNGGPKYLKQFLAML